LETKTRDAARPRTRTGGSAWGFDATVPLGESRERYSRVVVPGVDQVSW